MVEHFKARAVSVPLHVGLALMQQDVGEPPRVHATYVAIYVAQACILWISAGALRQGRARHVNQFVAAMSMLQDVDNNLQALATNVQHRAELVNMLLGVEGRHLGNV